MRVVLSALLSLGAVLGSAGPAVADAGDERPRRQVPGVVATAQDALRAGVSTEREDSAHRDLTLDLRAVYLARPDLDDQGRRAASRVLARPDEQGGGDAATWDPSAPRAKTCTAEVCVQYVTATKDAPPSPAWAQRSLEVAQLSLDRMAELGYPAPASDHGKGGTAQFDVYLAEISDQGLYGYCAPEKKVPGERHTASTYCVFDDDFTGFPMGPVASLRVTAAHELFHAVQFAMDVTEDPWFLEATATWMEEQIADDVNDNRQFLPAGQLGRRKVPLDTFGSDLGPYGNWIFFQHLAERYGVDAVRTVWNYADSTAGHRDDFSVRAVRRLVRKAGDDWAGFYGSFVDANLRPKRAYVEGSAYRGRHVDNSVRLRPHRRQWQQSGISVPHLSGRAVKFTTRRIRGKAHLRLRIDGGPRASAPSARVLVFKKSGAISRLPVKLDKQGRGHRRVNISAKKVVRVIVVLANASVRYRCHRSTQYACQGKPRDDDKRFSLAARVTR